MARLFLAKPWMELEPGTVARVPGQLGVYELGDDAGRTLYVGVAGGRSRFGLRGELERHLEGPAVNFRYEVNMQYETRYRELLMAYVARDGDLPPLNRAERLPRLGRLSLLRDERG